MVTSLSVAVRIWAKSLSLIAVIVCFACITSGEIWGVLIVAFGLLFAFFLTSPLLMILSPLVQYTALMPYTNSSKMTSLIFFLSVLHQLILVAFIAIVDGNLNGLFSKESAAFFLSIIVVQFIAVRTTRKRLYKLYEQHTWPQD